MLSRRHLLAGSAAAAGLAALAIGTSPRAGASSTDAVAFHGEHQAGIATPAQDRLVFAAFDVLAPRASAVRDCFAPGRRPRAASAPASSSGPRSASGSRLPTRVRRSASGRRASRSPSASGRRLFDDRFGLRDRRPAALAELPAFPGDDLDPLRSGGDLCVQACADDEQVAFHAVRNLARLGLGTVALRWLQVGFSRTSSTTSPGDAAQPPRLQGRHGQPARRPGRRLRPIHVGGRGVRPAVAAAAARTSSRGASARTSSLGRDPARAKSRRSGGSRTSGAPLTGHREHDTVDLAATWRAWHPDHPRGCAHPRRRTCEQRRRAAAPSRLQLADGVDPADRGARRRDCCSSASRRTRATVRQHPVEPRAQRRAQQLRGPHRERGVRLSPGRRGAVVISGEDCSVTSHVAT